MVLMRRGIRNYTGFQESDYHMASHRSDPRLSEVTNTIRSWLIDDFVTLKNVGPCGLDAWPYVWIYTGPSYRFLGYIHVSWSMTFTSFSFDFDLG